MRDFNKVIILGNLTRDPEMRYTPNGQAVCSFGVATNRRWTGSDGNAQESVEFHNVVAWGKMAETCSQILQKGRKVLVEGRLQTRTWDGQDGVKRNKTEIIAENFSALGSGKPREGGEFESQINQSAGGEKPTKESEIDDVIEEIDEKPEKSKEKVEKKPDEKSTKKEEDKIDLDDIPF